MKVLKINISGIAGLKDVAEQIRKAPDIASLAGQYAVNDVARTLLSNCSRDLTSRYNLPASYVRGHMWMTPSMQPGAPAVVSARIRHTRLARFDANQMTAAAPRANGDARRKISRGRKQAGVSVKVRRDGARKTIEGAFLMPLRAGRSGGSNGMGVFVREGSAAHGHAILTQDVFPGQHRWDPKKGRGARTSEGTNGNQLRHLYGPSVHQAFRWWLNEHAPDINDMLAKAFGARMAAELRKARK